MTWEVETTEETYSGQLRLDNSGEISPPHPDKCPIIPGVTTANLIALIRGKIVEAQIRKAQKDINV